MIAAKSVTNNKYSLIDHQDSEIRISKTVIEIELAHKDGCI